MGTLSQRADAFKSPRETLGALLKLVPAVRDWRLSLSQKLDRIFGDNEAVKCAVAANLSYYHDDPATLWWIYFAMAQGSYLLSGGRFVQGGSQRLSSALARAIRVAGGEVLVRRVVSGIALDQQGRAGTVTHTARDGSDPQVVEGLRIVSNAAPAVLAPLMPQAAAEKLTESYTARTPSMSLFALTLGLSKPPREFGISAYSTQLLPREMKRLSDYAQGAALMANEPGERMPPMSIVDYAAIDSGVPAPPYVLSILGPDLLSNWDSSDMDAYREKRGRWQEAIVRHLSSFYPDLAGNVVASSFNTALSVRQYLNAPGGAVYGFAPTPPRSIWRTPVRSPRTSIPGLYLASAYAGFGGYSGVVQSGGACADMILREN
jgi:phytoene dehydrogenase-like protein